MDLIKTGKIISEARKNKNMTQKQLATKLHISDKAISKWERGLGYPDISFLIPLSQILDVSLYELLSGEKEEVEETLKKAIHYSNKEIERKNKQVKKKSFALIFVILLFIFLFGYKLVNFMIYTPTFINDGDYKKIANGFQIKDSINVENIELNDSEYIKFDNIKFKNMFEGYEKNNQDGFASYVLKNENDETKYFFSIGRTDTYLSIVLSELNKLTKFKQIKQPEFFEGIDDDLELFNYIYLTRNYKPKITYKVKNLKKNYYEKMSSYIVLPQTKYITEIKGDLEGYIFNFNDNILEVNIKNKDKRIAILISGYDKQTLQDILNTLVIE